MRAPFRLSFPNCIRCGGVHVGVVFVALSRGEALAWADCPNTGEPILYFGVGGVYGENRPPYAEDRRLPDANQEGAE